MILLDSNILIDLLEPEGRWYAWSLAAVEEAAVGDDLATSTIAIAETADHFASLDEQLDWLADLGIATHPLESAAAYRAGQAHRAYRRAGGPRIGVLADFLIGGHAATLGATLLTRDRQRFASYFPELTIIAPENDNG